MPHPPLPIPTGALDSRDELECLAIPRGVSVNLSKGGSETALLVHYFSQQLITHIIYTVSQKKRGVELFMITSTVN